MEKGLYVILVVVILVAAVLLFYAYGNNLTNTPTTTSIGQSTTSTVATSATTSMLQQNVTNSTLALKPKPLITPSDAALLFGNTSRSWSYSSSLLNTPLSAADNISTSYSPSSKNIVLYNSSAKSIQMNVSGGWKLGYYNATKAFALSEVVVNTNNPASVYNRTSNIMISESKQLTNVSTFGGSSGTFTYLLYNGTKGNLRLIYLNGWTPSKVLNLYITVNRSSNVSVNNNVFVSVISKDLAP